MTTQGNYWEKFWEEKTDPLHTYSDKDYYKSYGKELSVFLPQNHPKSILELGCGSGSLYEPLGFNKAGNYVGVDLSQSMLDEFQASYPSVSLFKGSAESYRDNNSYDIIFTNGVIQYLSSDMLNRQISNALKMLSSNGIIIHSSVPWKVMRKQYIASNLMPPYEGMGVRAWLYYWATFFGLKKDKMGEWYSIKDFRDIENEFGLKATFYGSMYYPYRFHICLRRSSS
jgi:cyclopropane fatty-acyl-phospholipid synthase-like methyltransferase